ncbi:MAG: hypothetical protein ACFFD2_14965 [Promethearchaeota archaeon]
MKKYSKIGIFCLISLIGLSALTPLTVGEPTTIEDSTFPASDGEFYQWTCNYCNDSFDEILGEGSYYNITIGTIYQGSHMAIPNALIVPAIFGTYFKASDTHYLENVPDYCVYNASLQYIYFPFALVPPFILPIPLNLTMIAEFIESYWAKPTVVSGNSIIVDIGVAGQLFTFNYNSDGFCILFASEIGGELAYTYSLREGGGEEAIPFGNYFIVPTVISIAIIVIFIKKQHSINK